MESVEHDQALSALRADNLTLEELTGFADVLLRELVPNQSRYKVNERPDARTVRYYVSQGLLPKPNGYAGGRARYGGQHLLRLLFIKQRQSQHHTLRQIANQLRDASEADLEQALWPGPGPQPERGQAGPQGLAVTRFELGEHGAHVDVPTSLLRDPDRRTGVIDALRRVVASLESADPDPVPPEEPG